MPSLPTRRILLVRRRFLLFLWILPLALSFQVLSTGRDLWRPEAGLTCSSKISSPNPSSSWGLSSASSLDNDALENTAELLSSPASTSWVPRLSFVLVSLFQSCNLSDLTKNSADNKSLTFVPETKHDSFSALFQVGRNSSLSTAQQVANALKDATHDEEEIQAAISRLSSGIDEREDDMFVEMDTETATNFFPVPSHRTENQSTWNSTLDLVNDPEADFQTKCIQVRNDEGVEEEIVKTVYDDNSSEDVIMDPTARETTQKVAGVDSDAIPTKLEEGSSGMKKMNLAERVNVTGEATSKALLRDETEIDEAGTSFEEATIVDEILPVDRVRAGAVGLSNVEKISRRAAAISHSFYAKEFRPAWFAKNPHLQTIVGVKARQESMYFPTTGNLILSKFQWDQRQRVETPDGDFFDVDWKYTQTPVKDNSVSVDHDSLAWQTPLVLICHGLQSNTDSPLTKDMAIAFNDVGMDVAAINFRGCNGEPNRTPMGYHLSYTDDLEFMVQQISKTQPGRPIYLSGFSLGANVVTKFLADVGVGAAEKYNICGAAVNAVPFDLTKCQAINEPGFSGSVYGDKLFKSLQNRILESMETIKYNFTREELESCTNCREFDDLVVCSVYEDFANATDYHRKSSTVDRLHEIMVPQLILQALDDPFMVGNTNPVNDPSLPCRIQYTEHGGHCGYVFHSEERDKRDSSFMPTELARFVQHVHGVRTGQKSTTVALRTQSTTPMTANDIRQELMESSDHENLRRKLAASAANAFQVRQFVPAKWARNEHLQTIMGALFRRQTMYVNKSSIVPSLLESFLTNHEFQWDERQRMSTPDGDFFDVDWKYVDADGTRSQSSEDKPVVLICHGLQSDSSSPLAQDMAQAFNNVGMDVGCINFRGCSGEINKTPIGYHLGFTEDLKQMIEYINDKYPRRRIYLSGFSLGANVVTACLAELGEQAYDKHIFGAAVNAVPFDMPKAYLNLNKYGLTKTLYGGRLLASMVDRVEKSYDSIEFHFPREEAAKCRTILEMENLVIAPVFGFRDAYDYYEKASTLQKIDRVAVPELVIQAEDDPFFLGQSLPKLDEGRPLRVHMTQQGGHCGYVFHTQEEEDCTTSWMPTELARFLAHLEETFPPRFHQRAKYDASIAEDMQMTSKP